MTDEQLEIASDLKKRIDKLDKEIHDIMDLMPPVRENFRMSSDRGILRKIFKGKIINNGYAVTREIDLSNEDCRALIDLRTSEQQALKQVLKNIN